MTTLPRDPRQHNVSLATLLDYPELLKRCGDRPDFAERIALAFFSDLNDFDRMLDARSLETLRRAAHRIKGAAQQVSARNVANAAKALDTAACTSESSQQVFAARQKLKSEIAVLLAHSEELLTGVQEESNK